MMLDAASLIDREREKEFDAAVNKLAKQFAEKLSFKYTGP